MRVVLLGEPYSPARAAAALAAGKAAPAGPDARPSDAVLVPAADLMARHAGAAVLPAVVKVDPYILNDHRLNIFALVAEVTAHAAPGGGVTLDASSPAFGVLDPQPEKAYELVRAVARSLYYMPDPPVVVQFVPPHLLRYHLREWLRLVGGESMEARKEDIVGDPAGRLRAHLEFAAYQRTLHHPWSRLKRKLRVKWDKVPRRPRLPRVSRSWLLLAAGLAYLGVARYYPDWLPPKLRLW